ncbi:MAG: chemotaxis protein CheR [Gammaproteobacteria bacterium]|nr:chemotaxis protein CheR [Gammaproteobacteria bacterium]
MKNEQYVCFLQWALPQMRMRWPGFRKVRRQVCKRLDARIRDLGLTGVGEYQAYLQEHADEWARLDSLCRITISRFYRDKGVFVTLAKEVLPLLASVVHKRGDSALRIWSAGCGSGEEPYTLAALWDIELQSRFPQITMDIVATDADPGMIQRALDARYEFSSLKDLPESWRNLVFAREEDTYCIKPEYTRGIKFLEQDIRQEQPGGHFDLVLCRNLVFTYYDDALQRQLIRRIVGAMHGGAALVLGIHEHVPEGAHELSMWFDKQRIFRKIGDRN